MDMQAFNEDLIRRFRTGEPLEGFRRERLLLLTTVGRRSGEDRVAPMMFVEHDGDPLVIASADGAAQHPAWLLNLRADPRVTIETPDGATRQSVAEEVTGEERTALWDDLVADLPFLAEHQQRAGARVIPLVRLRPAD